MMQRLRVEPYSSYLERRRKGPISRPRSSSRYPVTVAGDFVFLSGLECLEAAGSSMAQVLKCNVYRSNDKRLISPVPFTFPRSPARSTLKSIAWR